MDGEEIWEKISSTRDLQRAGFVESAKEGQHCKNCGYYNAYDEKCANKHSPLFFQKRYEEDSCKDWVKHTQ